MRTRFVLIVAALSAVLFAYPIWRLCTWLQAPLPVAGLLTLLGFGSQFLVRGALRHRGGALVRTARASADTLLGISPVLLAAVLLGEVVVALTPLAANATAVAILITVTAVAAWGIRKAWFPEVVEVSIESAKIARPIRFVQISDVHIGSRTPRFLRRLMARIESLDPEFLCITGDFIDERDIGIDILRPLELCPGPIYFCTGNHEAYEDHDAILDRLRQLGVIVLRGDVVEQAELQIIGFDDHPDPDQLATLLPRVAIDPARFSILLYHRPNGLAAAAAHGIDLKLSGHTHNGQIKPFDIAVRSQFPYIRGLYRRGPTHLYVNEGTGTWGPTMRLGSRSEITCFTLRPAG